MGIAKTDRDIQLEDEPFPDDLRYSLQSIRQVDGVARDLGDTLRNLAARHAISQGRMLVTSEDVLSVLDEALSRWRRLSPPKSDRPHVHR